MNPKSYTYIAIDIASEEHWVQTPEKAFGILNDEKGFRRFLRQIENLQYPCVVVEATGAYERPLMRFLYRQGIEVVRVNPAQVRHLARSDGQKAKNDSLDAKLLLRFAQEKNLQPMPAPSPTQLEMGDWLDRRAQLTEEIAREKNRLEKKPEYTKTSIERVLKYLQGELAEVEKQIDTLIQSDPGVKSKYETMTKISGVGKVTAWTLLAQMPELTELSRNQAVALAGIAPFDRDSGKSNRPRRIHGGRAKVRRCLYMAAQTASIHNDHIREYVEKLRSRGKPYKVAMVAAMRKLLLHIQSQLKKESQELGAFAS